MTNMNIILGGEIETENRFQEMANDDVEFRKIFNSPTDGKYFLENSGFVRRETRFARTLYCIKVGDFWEYENSKFYASF